MSNDTMLPILRELIDADGDAVRAGVLLRLPDTILLKYRPVIEEACLRARFDAGLAFLDVRLASLRAVRGADGRLPPDYAADLERMLDAFAGAAKGEGRQSAVGSRGSEEPPAPSRPAAEPPSRVPAASGSVPAFSPDDRATGAIDGSGSKPPQAGVEDGRHADRLPGAAEGGAR